MSFQFRRLVGNSLAVQWLGLGAFTAGSSPICSVSVLEQTDIMSCARSVLQPRPGCLGVTPQHTALATGARVSGPSSWDQLQPEENSAHWWLLWETLGCLFFSSTD